MRVENWIANRLYGKSAKAGRVSRPAIRIATAGVAVGIAVMLVSIAVVFGFQSEIRSKVTGFGSHIRVLDYESLRDMDSSPIQVTDSLLSVIRDTEGVTHVQRYVTKAGMLKTQASFRGIQFDGVDNDFDPTFLQTHLIEGEIPSFGDTTSSQQIVISQQVAQQLNLHAGDRVYAYFFDKSVRARRFTVSGIYRTNMNDFDRSIVFASLNTIHALTSWQPDQYAGLEVNVSDFERIEVTQYKLINALGRRQDAYGSYYSVLSVTELYPTVFSWLSLLDMDVWVILILMTLVAGVTMVSGLLIIILERTQFIGIMKALGTTNAQLQRLFLLFAAQIILRGLFYGNVAAFVLLLTQRHLGLIHLDPEVYYMDVMPVLFHPTYMVLINLCTFAISLLAMVIPSFLVSKIHPARSIRFE